MLNRGDCPQMSQLCADEETDRMFRHNRPSATIATFCGRNAPLFVFLMVALCQDAAGLSPQMVRWEIEATVTSVVDPLGLFPDVRLGDPVRGMLKYDVTLFPNSLYSGPLDLYYTNDEWVDVTRMVIENPRNGTEFRFQTDISGDFADIDVFNDYPDDENGDFDGLYAPQSVVPPLGYTGTSPVVAVFLTGPITILPDRGLPSQLDLDDWPIAAMVFWDGYFEDPLAMEIEAEIYSLTAITEPYLPGDFNFDGEVNYDDYIGWRLTFGESGDWVQHYADGNDDDAVDAADYVLWRNAFSSTVIGDASHSFNAAVPEPSTIVLLGLIAVAWGGQSRVQRQCTRSRFSE